VARLARQDVRGEAPPLTLQQRQAPALLSWLWPLLAVYVEAIAMNIIIWLVVGGVIGWLASMVMKTDGQQGIILNVVVGILGAMLGGWLLSPLFGAATINQGDFSLAGLGLSLLGSVLLLGIVSLFRRGSIR
jgi:uncharacterized membrane protein YeaQ/YmgE (transglycosylase-associated protein family)